MAGTLTHMYKPRVSLARESKVKPRKKKSSRRVSSYRTSFDEGVMYFGMVCVRRRRRRHQSSSTIRNFVELVLTFVRPTTTYHFVCICVPHSLLCGVTAAIFISQSFFYDMNAMQFSFFIQSLAANWAGNSGRSDWKRLIRSP